MASADTAQFSNFKIGTEQMPKEVINAFTILKEACVKADLRLNNLDEQKENMIQNVFRP